MLDKYSPVPLTISTSVFALTWLICDPYYPEQINPLFPRAHHWQLGLDSSSGAGGIVKRGAAQERRLGSICVEHVGRFGFLRPQVG